MSLSGICFSTGPISVFWMGTFISKENVQNVFNLHRSSMK